ncbi:MAG: cytochrome c-type biogenesis protein [Kofleriaceae bacterium]
MNRIAWLLLLWWIVACSSPAPERVLERRLIAPCCWRQTLEDHESPVATSLRAEIRARLAAGEPAAAIELDLVGRYGERVRALPEGRDPKWVIATGTAVASFAGMGVLIGLVRRRRGRTELAAAPAAPGASARAIDGAIDDEIDEPYADRLDDELARID